MQQEEYVCKDLVTLCSIELYISKSNEGKSM